MRSSRNRTKKETKNSSTKITKQINTAKPQSKNIGINCQIDKDKMESPKFTMEALISILPTFEGNKADNIENFLKSFEQLIAEIEISESLKIIILKSKLTGKAKDFISEDDSLANIADFEDFKNKLKKLFKRTTTFESIQEEFLNLKQKPLQSIREFTRIFELTADKFLQKSGQANQPGAKEFLDSLKLSKFLNSIKPDISLEVRKNGPTSFQQALTLAVRIEKAFHSIPTMENNAIQDKNNELCQMLLNMSIRQDERFKELQEKIEHNSKSAASKHETNNIVATLFCHICSTNGHSTYRCWFNAKGPDFKRPENKQFNNKPRKQNYQQRPQNFSNNYGNKPNYNNRSANSNRNNQNRQNNRNNRNNPRDNLPMITLPENNENE